MEEIETREVRRRNPLLWPIRFLLHLIIKIVVLVVFAIRLVLKPRAVRLALVLLLVAGAVAWNFMAPFLPGQGAASSGNTAVLSAAPTQERVSVPASERLDPAPVVEHYLKAQSNFDATGMWDAISDDLKQQLARSNTTVQELQAQLDSARQSGRRYSQATYVGGATLEDGARAYFYVLTVDTTEGTMHVPYTYVVGSDEKIASIQ